MADDDAVIAVALASPILHYDWPRRGVAPHAYTKGMAVAFAQVYRKLKASNAFACAATVPAASAPGADVLDWYAPELHDAGALPLDTPAARLVALFAIMLGLGMRESSGEHCIGLDPNGQKPTTADNAEAGLFQVSHDSIDGDAQRQALFDAYRGRTDLLPIFSEHVHCTPTDWANHGTGIGVIFQDQMKRCPEFAVLYTALLLRPQRGHWGPINRREVEVRHDAVLLFQRLRTIVDAA